MFNSLKNFFKSSCIGAAILNMAMAYVAFMLCRVVFFLVNYSTFAPYMSWNLAGQMLRGAMVFDTSALLYLNALYLVVTLLPLHVKETKVFHNVAKWCYIIPNAVGVMANLIDAVYFQYTGRRTTMTVFSEFGNENNLAGIFGVELLRHWYLVLIFAAMVVLMWKLFRKPAVRHSAAADGYLQPVFVLTHSASKTAARSSGSTTLGKTKKQFSCLIGMASLMNLRGYIIQRNSTLIKRILMKKEQG